LTWQQILEQIGRTYTGRFETDTFDGEFELQDRLDEAEALLPTKGQDEELLKHLTSLRNKLKAVRGLRLQLRAELQMRPALALGCLFFVLVGCPVGIWFSRSDYLSSFITCFLPIVFLYYPLLLCGTGMAKDGKFDPALTVWAADVVMAVIGLYLFRKLLKN